VSRLALLLVVAAACSEEELPTGGAPWTVTRMLDPVGQFRPGGEPVRRLETATGALGTRLVIVGGFSASMIEGLPITTDVLAYDTQFRRWSSLPPAPVAWTHANVAAVGGAVYLLGGLDGRSFVAQPEAFVLEAGASEWTPLPPLPEARGAAAVVLSPGHIFLLGGASTTEVLATSLDFDIGTRTWSRMPVDLPTARSHAAGMRRYDGAFVIAGGLGDLTSGRPLGDVFTLPPNSDIWLLAEPMPTARGGCAYGVVFGSLLCAGGEAGLEALDDVEIYNPVLNAWTIAAPMPEPRAGARGTVVSNRLYIPGGSPTLDFEPTDSLFVFAPLTP
jgi:N-acetylneuraminic acid mutarotase